MVFRSRKGIYKIDINCYCVLKLMRLIENIIKIRLVKELLFQIFVVPQIAWLLF